jgi:hypothetical protein
MPHSFSKAIGWLAHLSKHPTLQSLLLVILTGMAITLVEKVNKQNKLVESVKTDLQLFTTTFNAQVDTLRMRVDLVERQVTDIDNRLRRKEELFDSALQVQQNAMKDWQQELEAERARRRNRSKKSP